MSNATTHVHQGTGASNTTKTRHTKKDALNNLQFELLLDKSYDFQRFQDLEIRFILLVGGRLGLRRGEIAHMQADWIDWRDRRLEIPEREPCRKGRDGGLCGMCKQHAKQKTNSALDAAAEVLVEVNRALDSDPDVRLRDFDKQLDKIEDRIGDTIDELRATTEGMTNVERARDALEERYYDRILDDRLSRMWEPKTENASRQVPFGFSARTEVVIDRYFDEFDEWMYVGNSINRRLEWVTEEVSEVDHVMPHALRATAATYHAGRGLDVLPLTNLFGWAKSETAENYVASNPDNLDRQLQFVHS